MVFNKVLIVLFFSYFTFAQEDEVMLMAPSPIPKKEIKREEVSFMRVEVPPIFPGCEKEKSRQAKRKCLQQGISDHIANHFNVDLANSLGLDPGRKRLLIHFKIDQKGNIKNIRAKAPHPKLEEEAIRLINKLPKMKPAKQRGQAVTVQYALPIIFDVEDEKPIKEEIKK